VPTSDLCPVEEEVPLEIEVLALWEHRGHVLAGEPKHQKLRKRKKERKKERKNMRMRHVKATHLV